MADTQTITIDFNRPIPLFPLEAVVLLPHASAPLCDGAVLDGKVVCHLHLWEFDLETGRCDVGDEWSVQVYENRVVDGRLEVCIAE